MTKDDKIAVVCFEVSAQHRHKMKRKKLEEKNIIKVPLKSDTLCTHNSYEARKLTAIAIICTVDSRMFVVNKQILKRLQKS